jgi:ferredoxin--NADP+ reductase
MGRITTLLEQGTVFEDLGLPSITPDSDRAMVSGSIGLNTDMKAFIQTYGLREGANSDPAEFVVEKAFVG